MEVQPLAENIKDPVCQVLFETLDDTISFCSALEKRQCPPADCTNTTTAITFLQILQEQKEKKQLPDF